MTASTRNVIWLGLVAGILAMVSAFPTGQLAAQEFLRAPRYVPHTATVVTRYYDDAGSLKATIVSLRARRADGSLAKVKELVRDEVSGVKLIVDTVAGQRVAVDPVTQSKTTYHMSPKAILEHEDFRQGACEKSGEEVEEIAGLEARKFRQEISQGNARLGPVWKTVVERWLAPALNCEPLRVDSHMVSPDGTLRGRTVDEVISVTLGEPNQSLFEVPEYPEKSPSQVMAEYDRIHGRNECETCARSRSAQDAAYNSAQIERR